MAKVDQHDGCQVIDLSELNQDLPHIPLFKKFKGERSLISIVCIGKVTNVCLGSSQNRCAVKVEIPEKLEHSSRREEGLGLYDSDCVVRRSVQEDIYE